MEEQKKRKKKINTGKRTFENLRKARKVRKKLFWGKEKTRHGYDNSRKKESCCT